MASSALQKRIILAGGKNVYPFDAFDFSDYNEFMKLIDIEASYENRYQIIKKFVPSLAKVSGTEGLTYFIEILETLHHVLIEQQPNQQTRMKKYLNESEKYFMNDTFLNYLIAHNCLDNRSYIAMMKRCNNLTDYMNLYFTTMLKEVRKTRMNVDSSFGDLEKTTQYFFKQLDINGTIDIDDIIFASRSDKFSEQEKLDMLMASDRVMLPVYFDDPILGVHVMIIAGFLGINIIPFSTIEQLPSEITVAHDRPMRKHHIAIHDFIHWGKYGIDLDDIALGKETPEEIFVDYVQQRIATLKHIKNVESYHFYKYFTLDQTHEYYDYIIMFIIMMLNESYAFLHGKFRPIDYMLQCLTICNTHKGPSADVYNYMTKTLKYDLEDQLTVAKLDVNTFDICGIINLGVYYVSGMFYIKTHLVEKMHPIIKAPLEYYAHIDFDDDKKPNQYSIVITRCLLNAINQIKYFDEYIGLRLSL